MPYEYVTESVRVHGVFCSRCTAGWERMTDAARAAIGTPCQHCRRGVYRELQRTEERTYRVPVCACGSHDASERTSLGIYAGVYCDPCWKNSGYRPEGREGFDPLDAGEAYEPDDY